MRLFTLLAVGLLLLSSRDDLRAEAPHELENNPFSRPPSIAAVKIRPLVSADGSVLELDLHATLVASDKRLANVAGHILRPGQEVDGYTLLQVFENRAVFSRDGRRLTIYVKPDLAENNE